MHDIEDIMDEALDILQDTGPEYSGGLSNHGPMAAEAFLSLGQTGKLLPWVQFYRNRLYLRPQSTNRITDDLPGALGDFERYSDWVGLIQETIDELGWTRALRKWVPVLAPGSIGAGAHGLIRTAHAVRSLCRKRTPQRKAELAQALAYWAARFQKLPGASGNSGNANASTVLKSMPLVPEEKKFRFGLISKKIQAVDSFPPFQQAVRRLHISDDLPAALSSMTEAFCAAYLASARDAKTAIVMIHSVTLLGAVRTLLPFLEPHSAEKLVKFGWRASAAIYSVFGKGPGEIRYMRIGKGTDELVQEAVETGDEHAIKFTEACLREYRLNPEPVYIAAALDATGRLGEISKFVGG